MSEKDKLTIIRLAIIVFALATIAASVWADNSKNGWAIALAVVSAVLSVLMCILFYKMAIQRDNKDKEWREAELQDRINAITGQVSVISDEERIEKEKDPIKRIELLAKLAKKRKEEEEQLREQIAQSNQNQQSMQTGEEFVEQTSSLENGQESEQSQTNSHNDTNSNDDGGAE